MASWKGAVIFWCKTLNLSSVVVFEISLNLTIKQKKINRKPSVRASTYNKTNLEKADNDEYDDKIAY